MRSAFAYLKAYEEHGGTRLLRAARRKAQHQDQPRREARQLLREPRRVKIRQDSLANGGDPPDRLLQQLKVGGRMVAPIGDVEQSLDVITKTASGFERTPLMEVRFGPMLGVVEAER